MKNVTASEARKNWFRLLDEALNGEVIAVQRKGRRLVLRREELADNRMQGEPGSIKQLLHVPMHEKADRWSWEWRGPENTPRFHGGGLPGDTSSRHPLF